jgi:integrase
MLMDDVERYLALRQTLGFKLQHASRLLRTFARFATAKGDSHVRAGHRHRMGGDGLLARATPSPARDAGAARTLPPGRGSGARGAAGTRRAPYICSQDELIRMLDAAGRLRAARHLDPLRPHTYVMLLGLIAATGLRLSESLNLEFGDLLPGGILRIRETKFCKSRLVPMHETVVAALERYLEARSRIGVTHDRVFVSQGGQRLRARVVEYGFQRVLRLAGIAPGRTRRPRIHDLRHSFATRVLEQCTMQREAVAQHFVALATYLGHTNPRATYWYLEATPQLMTHIAGAAEALFGGEVA